MLISFFKYVTQINEKIFAPVDNLIESLPFSDWAIDAISDSIHILPFLFFVFLLIEIIEFYWADKINFKLKNSGKFSVLVGSLAAIFPQCGFSIIASSLYINKAISKGCLIAVYLATSDEAIPILLASPSKALLVIPIVGIKFFIAILAGYFIDFALKPKIVASNSAEEIEEGCCKHDIEHGSKKELIIHPIFHTANIFVFVLMITLVLNFWLAKFDVTSFITSGKISGPIIGSFVGLIPNCAISLGATMMLIKSTISFGTAMSVLLSNAGLGLLVLIKKNDFQDTLKIIFILLLISIISGITINLLN